jgi:hypothetical protein
LRDQKAAIALRSRGAGEADGAFERTGDDPHGSDGPALGGAGWL